jgi:hypothetical protein
VTGSFGIATIVVGSSLGLFTAFVLWRRVPAFVGVSCAAGAGAMIGAGALLVQEAQTAADWLLTLTVLGGLMPLHARLLLGPAGRGT